MGPAHGGCRHESRPAACSACDVWTECSVRAVCVHATPGSQRGRSPAPGTPLENCARVLTEVCRCAYAARRLFVDCPLGCAERAQILVRHPRRRLPVWQRLAIRLTVLKVETRDHFTLDPRARPVEVSAARF